jgi:hypothetical protein
MSNDPTDPAPSGDERPPRAGWINAENARPGSAGWRPGGGGTIACDDRNPRIQGYASATSVNLGESIDFHVAAGQDITVGVYRIGWYGGTGSRLVCTSPTVTAPPPTPPQVEPETGLVRCDWPAVWRLTVPRTWVSGLYVAVFTSADGHQAVTPFVVRDDARPARLLVVLPFIGYQAENSWPGPGPDGQGPAVGDPLDPDAPGQPDRRRTQLVSFDRPYRGYGLPAAADDDLDVIAWLERGGYDAVYCSDVDLHAGRVDPARYDGVIVSGRGEYWTAPLRAAVERATATGTSLAVLSATSAAQTVRFAENAEGRPDRVLVCQPATEAAGPENGPTGAALDRQGPDQAASTWLGNAPAGVVAEPAPLVVAAADHWFWAGSGAVDGDRIDAIVGGQADRRDDRAGRPAGATATVVAVSPFRTRAGTDAVQHTTVEERPDGSLTFVAGTQHWARGLNRDGYADARLQAATRNLVERMLQPRRLLPPDPSAAPRRLLFYEGGAAPTTRSVRELGTLARAGWHITVAHAPAATEAVRELGYESLLLPEAPANPILERLTEDLAGINERRQVYDAQVDALLRRFRRRHDPWRKLLQRRSSWLTAVINREAALVRRLRAAANRVAPKKPGGRFARLKKTRTVRALRRAGAGFFHGAEALVRWRMEAAKARRMSLANRIRNVGGADRRALEQVKKERSVLAARARAVHAARRTPAPLSGGVLFGDLARWEPRWQADAVAMASFDADVVWVADLDALPAAIWAAEAMANKPPVIFDSHELFTEMEYLPELYREAWVQLAKQFIPRATVVLAVSEPITDVIRDELGAREAITLHNLALPGPAPKRGVRDVIGLAPDVPLAVHIGHISYARRISPDAILDLLTGVPELHLAFVGTADGTIRDDLRQAATENGTADRLHFVDPVPLPQLGGFVGQADISILLHDGSRSRDNAFAMPNKLFDSLAAGLPVLAPRSALPAEFVEREGLGRGFHLDRPGDLAAAARALLADQATRERVRQRRAEFSWSTIEPTLVRLVNRVALAGGSRR